MEQTKVTAAKGTEAGDSPGASPIGVLHRISNAEMSQLDHFEACAMSHHIPDSSAVKLQRKSHVRTVLFDRVSAEVGPLPRSFHYVLRSSDVKGIPLRYMFLRNGYAALDITPSQQTLAPIEAMVENRS